MSSQPTASRADDGGNPPRDEKGKLPHRLAEKSGEFEVVAQTHDADGPMQDRALELVKKFIIEKGLIVYGGLAIDYALRVRGGRLYPDGKRPDYDAFSPRHHEAACELADRLHKAGFANVGAIRAIHVQTMRVRTDFIFVADFSHVPEAIFDKLPTVASEGMRVLHPDYQRMDMHLSLSFPFSDAPREAVFHRWSKDVRRFNMLRAAYNSFETTRTAKPDGKTTRLTADVGGGEVVYHGLAALGLLADAYRDLTKAEPPVRVRTSFGKEPPRLAVELPEAEAKSYGRRLAVASPDPLRVIGGRACRWFEPLMDQRPVTAVVEGGKGEAELHVYATRGRKLAVVAVRGGEVPVLMVAPHYLLLGFLLEHHTAEDPETRRQAAEYYSAAMQMMIRGAKKLAELGADAKLVNSSPFGLPVRTVGDSSRDGAYVIKIASLIAESGKPPPASLGFPETLTQILIGLPENYHPAGGKKPSAFDSTRNVLFRRSGAPIGTDDPWVALVT